MPSAKKKAPKYGNNKLVIDGIRFDSKVEAGCYVEASTYPAKFNLDLQKKFEIHPKYKADGKTIQAINYICDFYITKSKFFKKPEYVPRSYVIDVKGIKTNEFKLKEKLFMYKHCQPIICVKSANEMRFLLDMIENNIDPWDCKRALEIKPKKKTNRKK